MRTCSHCARQIKGQCVLITPPLFVTQLTGEGTKAYHPSCYKKAEEKAERELHGKPERSDY